MTLSGLWEYVVQNFVNWIIYGVALIVIMKNIRGGETGKAIMALFIAAFAWVFANGPAEIMGKVGEVVKKMMGGA